MKNVNLSGFLLFLSFIPELLNSLYSLPSTDILKKSILSAGLIALTSVCIAQDVIVTKDSKKINAKVTEIDIDLIRFIKYDNLDGPVYTIPKSDVVAILYENGKAETFAAESVTSAPKPSVSVYPDEKVPVAFNDGDNWGLKDTAGTVIVAAKYARINEFSEGVAAVNTGGKSKTVYKLVGGISGRYLPFKKFEGGKWGFINTRGIEVIPCKYDDAENFSEGLAVVKIKNKYGFVDKTGMEMVPCTYDYAKSFSEGRAVVGIGVKVKKGAFSSTVSFIELTGGKYGFIDSTGNELIPVIYNSAESFKNGKAQVNLEGTFFIDMEGKRI